ncbi:c-type cytochrome [Hydrogenimonas sp.]
MRQRWFLLAVLSVSFAFGATSAEQLVEKKCAVCHMTSNPTAEQVKHMVAPPMWGVARHLKRSLKSREAYVSFVADYILSPAKEKIRFNKEAMERFGLMPSMKGSISEEEARRIAGHLYDTY